MNINTQVTSQKKNSCRMIVKVSSWIHIILAALIILRLMWEFTELNSNAPVEELVKSLVLEKDDPEDYSPKEITEMTIGFLIFLIIWHLSFMIVSLSLLSGTKKDSLGVIKFCLICLTVLFLLSCVFLAIEISHLKRTSSSIFYGSFLIFQGITNIAVYIYLKIIQKSRKAEEHVRQRSFRSNSTSSDFSDMDI